MQQPILKITSKKIQINLNHNFQNDLSHLSSSNSRNVSAIIRYIQPALQKSPPLNVRKINDADFLSNHVIELLELAKVFDRKRERFNHNTFYL